MVRVLQSLPRIRACPVELFRVSEAEDTGLRLRGDPGYHRVRPGVYTPAPAWNELRPWDRYLVRVHALHLVRPDAILCLESAAVLIGQPIFGEPRDIHIFDPDRASSTRSGDVCIHTSADRRAVVEMDGALVTSIVDTALDLIRVLPPALGLAVADATVGRDFGVPLDELRDAAASQQNRRGRRRLDWVLEHADGSAESVGESVSRAVIDWWGFERPELQVEFHYEGCRDRGDFYWRRIRHVGEFDGEKKYHGLTAEEIRRIVIAEKNRENRLRRHEGGMIRWDWKDALRATPVRDRLLAAGVRQERPIQRAMLLTLRTHPRSY